MKKLRKIWNRVKLRLKVLKVIPKTFSNLKMLISASNDHLRFILDSRIVDRVDRVKADIMYIRLINRVKKDSIDVHEMVENIRYVRQYRRMSVNDYLSFDGTVFRIKGLGYMMFLLYKRGDISTEGLSRILNVSKKGNTTVSQKMTTMTPTFSINYDKWVKRMN